LTTYCQLSYSQNRSQRIGKTSAVEQVFRRCEWAGFGLGAVTAERNSPHPVATRSAWARAEPIVGHSGSDPVDLDEFALGWCSSRANDWRLGIETEGLQNRKERSVTDGGKTILEAVLQETLRDYVL